MYSTHCSICVEDNGRGRERERDEGTEKDREREREQWLTKDVMAIIPKHLITMLNERRRDIQVPNLHKVNAGIHCI